MRHCTTLALKPADDSQRAAQSKMAIALYTALDAGRQLIAISEPAVGTVKWMAILASGTLHLGRHCHRSQQQPARMRYNIDALCNRHCPVRATHRRL